MRLLVDKDSKRWRLGFGTFEATEYVKKRETFNIIADYKRL